MAPAPRFASVVLDVDSTLSATEGIAYLAALRGPDVVREVTAVTDRAMEGSLPLEAVYAARLARIQPSRSEISALGEIYVRTLLPGARDCVATLREAGVHVTLVSGGIRQAVLSLASALRVPACDVHAVDLMFTDTGEYAGFDARSPLARSGGKPALVRSLALAAPTLAVGDGATDAELRTIPPAAVQALAAFTGVASRDVVLRAADYVAADFGAVLSLVMP